MPVTRYDDGVTGFSSTFIFRKVILSPCWSAISSRIGCDLLARAAPLRPEVHQDGLVGLEDLRVELGVGHGLDLSHGGHLSHDWSTPDRIDER